MSKRLKKAGPRPSAISPPGQAAGKGNHPLFVCLLLALATLAAFAPLLWCGFAGYDDTAYVTDNWHVLRGLSWAQVDWAFSNSSEGFWQPLTWLSHMLDCQLFGLRAWGHHLTSLLLHTANTLVLFLALRRITGATWRSALAAALFALHPLHVEAVAFIAERKEVLSAFFGLLSLWAYAAYVAALKTGNAKSKTYFALALICFAAALMSKTMVVTLPLILFLLDYWPLGRWQSGAENQPSGLRRLLLEKAPFLLLALAAGLITLNAERTMGAVAATQTIPLPIRAANAAVSCAQYLRQTFWPTGMAVIYPYPKHFSPALVTSAVLLLAVISLAAAILKRRPYFAIGWLWFLVMLLPVSGLFYQVGAHSRADRYTYLPLIGVFIALAWGAGELWLRWRAPKPLAITLAVVVLAACAWRTQDQLRYWRGPESLFRHALAVTDDNAVAYNNLGYYLMSVPGRLDEAIADLRTGVQLDPKQAGAWNTLGIALSIKGQNAEAVSCYEQALRIQPDHPDANDNLANALSDAGHLDEAIQHYELALKTRPDFANAHNNLGVVLVQKGQLDEALKHFRAAVYFQPGNATAHNSLGNVYVLRHQYADALPEFETALRLNPSSVEAHNNFGYALDNLERTDEAIAQYRIAIQLNANYAPAHYNLGCALAKTGRSAEAIAQLQAALRLNPNYPEAQQKLRELTTAAGQ